MVAKLNVPITRSLFGRAEAAKHMSASPTGRRL